MHFNNTVDKWVQILFPRSFVTFSRNNLSLDFDVAHFWWGNDLWKPLFTFPILSAHRDVWWLLIWSIFWCTNFPWEVHFCNWKVLLLRWKVMHVSVWMPIDNCNWSNIQKVKSDKIVGSVCNRLIMLCRLLQIKDEETVTERSTEAICKIICESM